MAYGPPQLTIKQHMPRMMPAMPLARPGNLPTSGKSAPGGLAGFLAQPGLRDLLLATGSALMAQADQPGSLAGALGRALPHGMQAFQHGREEAQINELLETAPPQMQALLKALPASARVPALLQMMKKPEPERMVVAEGGAVVEDGKEVYKNVRPEKPADAADPFKGLPAEAQFVMWGMGIDPGKATPEQRAAAMERYSEMQVLGKGPLVTVNTGDKDISKLPVGVQSGIVGAQGARDALNRFEGYAKEWLGRSKGDRAMGQAGVPDQERDVTLGNIESSRQELVLTLKNLAELGVLAGPDMEILDKMIGDPTSKEALVRSPDYALTRIKRVREYVDNKIDIYEKTYGIKVPKGAPAAKPVPGAGAMTPQGAALLKRLQGGT